MIEFDDFDQRELIYLVCIIIVVIPQLQYELT